MLAVTAAVAALLAGHHANEAMLEQMQATDQWAYYQAKGIKRSLVENKLDILAAVGKEPREDDRKKIERYKEEQKEIEDKAKELERSSDGPHAPAGRPRARGDHVPGGHRALRHRGALAEEGWCGTSASASAPAGTVFLVQALF